MGRVIVAEGIPKRDRPPGAGVVPLFDTTALHAEAAVHLALAECGDEHDA